MAETDVNVSNTMDRNTFDERRRVYGMSSDQYSASGDSEHSSDSHDSRQVRHMHVFVIHQRTDFILIFHVERIMDFFFYYTKNTILQLVKFDEKHKHLSQILVLMYFGN